MIQSSIGEAQVHGAALASLAAVSDEEAADMALACLNGTEKQRLGAAHVYAANLTTSRFRQQCAQSLLRLFNDDSQLVRNVAAEVIRQFSGTELGDFADVAEGLLNSKAAADNWDGILQSLVETSSAATSLALLTCERVLASSGEGVQDPVSYRADLVSQILVRVYTDGAAEIRSRALDLIDMSLRQNIHAQRVLATHDRAWHSVT